MCRMVIWKWCSASASSRMKGHEAQYNCSVYVEDESKAAATKEDSRGDTPVMHPASVAQDDPTLLNLNSIQHLAYAVAHPYTHNYSHEQRQPGECRCSLMLKKIAESERFRSTQQALPPGVHAFEYHKHTRSSTKYSSTKA
jgi:hypothetical protein